MRDLSRSPSQVEGDLSGIRGIVFGHVRGADSHGIGISDSLISRPAERVKCPCPDVRIRDCDSIGELIPRVKADEFRILLENLSRAEILPGRLDHAEPLGESQVESDKHDRHDQYAHHHLRQRVR